MWSLYHVTELQSLFFIRLEEKDFTFLHRLTIPLHSIPTTTQLAVALQFLATGSFQTVVASSHGISQPSVSRCIRTVTDVLWYYATEYIVFPNQAEQLINQQRFYERSGFHNSTIRTKAAPPG